MFCNTFLMKANAGFKRIDKYINKNNLEGKLKILLLSRYGHLGASSRYRSYQYIPYLRKEGIEITVAPLFDNDYIKDLYAGKKIF